MAKSSPLIRQYVLSVNSTICSKCQFDGEDFAIFCGLLRKHFKELMKVEELLEQMVMVQLELVELVDFPKENNFES